MKTRLAARDDDLHDAETALADAVSELETLRAETRRSHTEPTLGVAPLTEAPAASARGSDPESAADLEALERELAEAEEELMRLRAAAAQPQGDPALRRQIEELEAELATLESLRCPSPAAHRLPLGDDPGRSSTDVP